MQDIQVPISPGELLDKITILRIKAERMHDAAKLDNVRRELALLQDTWDRHVPKSDALQAHTAALANVNAQLWDIEDRIRVLEGARRFDAEFIELARAVYMRNDERAEIKKRVNLQLNSTLIEEKSYQPYR